MSTAQTSGEQLEAEAFRKLYPENFLSQFLKSGIRPDGRPPARCRDASVVRGVVSTADSSALAKLGNSTALAGIKLELFSPTVDAPDAGRLQVNFEIAPLCSPSARPGRAPRSALSAQEHVSRALVSSGLFDLKQLCITRGVSAWIAYLDIYILDADGAVPDVALLAAVAALQGLTLPAIQLNPEGFVLPPGADSKGATPVESKRVALAALPVSLTCGVYKGTFLADPTAEEEALLEAAATVAVDGTGCVVGLSKPGGVDMDEVTIRACVEAAVMRHKQVAKALAN